MRAVGILSQIFLLCLVLVGGGCESVPATGEAVVGEEDGFDFSVYADYTPVKIEIMPLTEIIDAGDNESVSRIDVYVSLLDRFGCQMKSPVVFRFEVYEKVQRSAEPKGGRIVIWPDVDLTEPGENNSYWRDFLRAYEFNLDFARDGGRSCILQVTCLCPNGKRLLAEFDLKQAE